MAGVDNRLNPAARRVKHIEKRLIFFGDTLFILTFQARLNKSQNLTL